MILQTKVRDPRLGLVTITNVKVSRDLGYADIAVTFIVAGPAKEERSDQERAEILQKASAYIRMELAAHLKLRAIPHLRFHFDLNPELVQIRMHSRRVSGCRGVGGESTGKFAPAMVG